MDEHLEAPSDNARPDDPIATGVHTLYRMLLADGDLDETLRRVADLAAASLPGCDFADITLVRDAQPVTKGASDPRARDLDAVQYSTDAGPCLDAWRHARIVRVASTGAETRWPKFARAAVDAGVKSMVAIPLNVRNTVIGALNLYSTAEHGFADSDVEIGQLFADQAAVTLENAHTHHAAVTLAFQLQQALDTRGPIEQAKGILMARHGCTAREAFARLVERSQHENRKLRVVAADIVAETQLEPRESADA